MGQPWTCLFKCPNSLPYVKPSQRESPHSSSLFVLKIFTKLSKFCSFLFKDLSASIYFNQVSVVEKTSEKKPPKLLTDRCNYRPEGFLFLFFFFSVGCFNYDPDWFRSQQADCSQVDSAFYFTFTKTYHASVSRPTNCSCLLMQNFWHLWQTSCLQARLTH